MIGEHRGRRRQAQADRVAAGHLEVLVDDLPHLRHCRLVRATVGLPGPRVGRRERRVLHEDVWPVDPIDIGHRLEQSVDEMPRQGPGVQIEEGMPVRRRRGPVTVVVGRETGPVVVGGSVVPAVVGSVVSVPEGQPEVQRGGAVLGIQGAGVASHVVLGVHVVLDEVVTLPVVAVGAAGLGVGVGVSSDVGGAVRHPADRESDPGLGVGALVVGGGGRERRLRLLEEDERELVSLAVVEHVRPIEGVVAEPLRHTGRQHAEPVAHLREQPLERGQDRRGELVEDLGELGREAAGELGGELGVVRRDRVDPLLPLADELAVDDLPDVEAPLDDLADHLASRVLEVGQQVEEVRPEGAEREVIAPGMAVVADVHRLGRADGKARRDRAVPHRSGGVVGRFHVDVPTGHGDSSEAEPCGRVRESAGQALME